MTMITTLSTRLLWTEFLLLYAGVPVGMTVFFGYFPLFPVLGAITLVALALLLRTPGFSSRELLRGPVLRQWPLIADFAAGALALVLVVTMARVPDRVFDLPCHRPVLCLAIMALYPFLSAMPQEWIFRLLFFRRYGALFPSDRLALATNAAAFGLAHLFYRNPVAIGLATLGGLVFGWAYQRHDSVLLCVVLHATCGMLIFTVGLGVYFYHGAIGHAP